MKWFFTWFCLSHAIIGCKTGGESSIKETSTEIPLGRVYCSFDSPLDKGERMQVWVDQTSDGQLQNLSFVQTEAGVEKPRQTVVSATKAKASDITKQGERGLRSIFKTLVNPKFDLFACLSLTSEKAQASYVCLDQTDTPKAFWATNLSARRYSNDLTFYQTVCKVR